MKILRVECGEEFVGCGQDRSEESLGEGQAHGRSERKETCVRGSQ